MCSYGIPLEKYSSYFSDFVRKLGKPVVQRKICLQNDGSNVCGQYALYFLYCKFLKQHFYCKFTKNRIRNDMFVTTFIQKRKPICINKKKDVQVCTPKS